MDLTPYSGIAPYFDGGAPTWVSDELDRERLQAYAAYERIYDSTPDAFRLQMRGTNASPIYIPSGRIIVNTTCRYVGAHFAVNVSPTGGGKDTEDVVAARQAIAELMRRERFKSQFNGNKRWGAIRGDWLWHVTGDASREAGRRISINVIDAGMYFPITMDDDVDTVIGCHLAEQTVDDQGNPRIKRTTYRKVTGRGGPSPITVESGLFKVDKWGMPGFFPEEILIPVTQLPPSITAIPVYHHRNDVQPANPFGRSEMAGVERLMAGINQTMSDEELALVLLGVGAYWTDAPTPKDAQGNDIAWRIGPGHFLHVQAGERIGRLEGVSTFGPFGEHYERLVKSLREGAGTPDIAVGVVGVDIAESGISRLLQLAPMLAKAEERNDELIDTQTRMWFDIVNGWMPAFEILAFDDVTVEAACGSAVPQDRAERFRELSQLKTDGIIDSEFYRAEVAKMGYVFPDGMAERAKAEHDEALGVDIAAVRTNEEIANGQ